MLHIPLHLTDERTVLRTWKFPAIIGAVGLLVGVVTAVTELPALGILAGTLALLAGLCSKAIQEHHSSTERVHELEQQATRYTDELAATVIQLQLAQTRVQELETQAETASTQPEPAESQSLTDEESQLLSQAYFDVALDARIASARRHLRPVAVALIEVDAMSTTPVDGLPALPRRVADSILQTVRDADTACRLSDGVFAIILEDTPENGAVWTVERIRRNLVSRYGEHTMRAGVACYPAHAFSADELHDRSQDALRAARQWDQDRIEVATVDQSAS